MSNEDPIVFQEETYQEVIEDMKPLLDLHWEEIALYQDKIPLNPDFEKYEYLSDQGAIRFFTARQSEELVGYFVVTLSNHMHYKDHTFAINDVIYLKRDSRAAGIGKRLIQFAEDKLKKSGVSVVMVNTKTHQPFDPLMKSLGYDCVERIYGKFLED